MVRLTLIWKLMRGQRLRYCGALGALIVASCLLYAAALMPMVVFDIALGENPEDAADAARLTAAARGGAETVRGNIWLPVAAFVIVTGLAGGFTFLRAWLGAHASEAIARGVRDRVYGHLQRLPLRYFDKAETGDLIQRCTSDVETLRLFLSSQIVEIGRAVFMLALPLPLMFWIDARLAWASLALIPVIVLFSVLFFLRVKARFKQKDEAEAAMTTVIQENLAGIRVVRAFSRQAFERDKMARANTKHRILDARLYNLMAVFWSSSDLICLTQSAGVIVYGAVLVADGSLTPGSFYFFIAAVNMFLWPVRHMGRVLTDLGKAVVALDRLQEILDEPEEAGADALPGGAVPQLTGGITFTDVAFAHAENAPVLRGVSFSIEAGQTLGILGPSGCGKTTIVNLLLRLYDHDAGSITLDGHDIRSIPRRDLRRQTSVVMQEPFLFSRTISENLRMASGHATEDELVEAASIAAVHENIAAFEQGYDTRVGERGVTLSGGQRQRVAIARSLLQDPAVLILDDALSAVDTETESMILDAIRDRAGRHTTVIIAHRLSAVMHADLIIVMDEGRVTQSGTHETLRDQPGLYARLWNMQTEPGDINAPDLDNTILDQTADTPSTREGARDG